MSIQFKWIFNIIPEVEWHNQYINKIRQNTTIRNCIISKKFDRDIYFMGAKRKEIEINLLLIIGFIAQLLIFGYILMIEEDEKGYNDLIEIVFCLY